MLTQTAARHPLFACLTAAEAFLGPARTWTPASDIQREFLRRFAAGRDDVPKIPDLRAMASRDHAEVTRFLAECGFPGLQLAPWGPGAFGVAGVLDVSVEWLEEGDETEIDRDGRDYPAVLQKHGVAILMLPGHAAPVARLRTRSDDVVTLTAHPQPLAGFALLDFAAGAAGALRPAEGYGGAAFPMIDYDRAVDVSWLQGMETVSADGISYEVAEAIQQTRFRMNQFGARAQSAAAMTMRPSSVVATLPPLVIDQPFVLAITRPGLSMPLFCGWFDTDTWADPGTLE